MTISSGWSVLVHGTDIAWRERVSATLDYLGWQIATEPSSGTETEAPALIMIDANVSAVQSWFADPWREGIVVLAVGSSHPAFPYDAVVANQRLAEELGTLGIAPAPNLPAATQRLCDTFGQGKIEPMLLRFAQLLADALTSLGTDGGGALAHRVAGVAGTLGFADLGRAWLAVSEHDDSPSDRLKVASRIAIGTIRRTYITGSY